MIDKEKLNDSVESIESDNELAIPTKSKEEELSEEILKLKDDFIRAMAEIQNLQRRSSEEIKKAREYGIGNFAKEIIPVRDYLEIALKDVSNNFEGLKTGVELTLQQLNKAFEQQEIKEISPTIGDRFDTNLHQAVTVIEDTNQASNTIAEVLQKGYFLYGRVLRTAMVTVAK